MTECMTCGAALQPKGALEKGEIITCQECGTQLEVTSVNPLKVEKAPEEQEDWGE